MGLELSFSLLMQDDSKGKTMHVKIYRDSSLNLSQKMDLYAVFSDCISRTDERSLKNIALVHCGYINTATRLYSYSWSLKQSEILK